MEKVSLSGLPALAERVLGMLPHKTTDATLVTLSGELGAGKTTFVQALGKKLGIEETMQSPTYVLMKSYKIPQCQGDTLTPGLPKESPFKKLIHIDAYRLTKPEEFTALEPETFLNDAHALVVLEWPEQVEGMLPKPDIAIKFSSQDVGEGERYYDIS